MQPTIDLASYELQNTLKQFWDSQITRIQQIPFSAFRAVNGSGRKEPQSLPIARIKKIIKIEDNVKKQMISGEVPTLLAKAAEMLIEEMTLRAWFHTQENRRKTIQKNDVVAAAHSCDMFDFLVDILPHSDTFKQRQMREAELNSSEDQIIEEENDYMPQGEQQIQYYTQYSEVGEAGAAAANDIPPPQLQVDGGRIIQATQIGPSIPLSGSHGQTFQIMNSDQIQFVPVSGNGHPPNGT